MVNWIRTITSSPAAMGSANVTLPSTTTTTTSSGPTTWPSGIPDATRDYQEYLARYQTYNDKVFEHAQTLKALEALRKDHEDLKRRFVELLKIVEAIADETICRNLKEVA